jgi:hypothetical protein
MAKALCWAVPDIEERKLGERSGLDTRVVLAVNDGYSMLPVTAGSVQANAISIPPGEYARKSETQRN